MSGKDDGSKDEKDEGKKSPINWAKATPEQLEAAAAELKRRNPTLGFDDVKWSQLSPTDFAIKRGEIFNAMRKHTAKRDVRRKNAAYDAEDRAAEERAAGE